MNKTKLIKMAKAIVANPIVRIAAVRILDVALNKLTKAKKR